MKRRNLFLSLICSLILTVALVTVTVVSLVPKKQPGTNDAPVSGNVSDTGNQEQPDITVNEERDGSAEKPYVVYSAETFETFIVDKYLDEEGNYIDYTQVDEEGNLVYPELNAGLYYELDADIDFAGTEFTTIFNQGVAFNGHINGNGHTIKNININVTKENIVDAYSYTEDGELVANIGIFGELDGATIENITFSAVSISMEDGLYEYIWNADFKTDYGTMNAITVGALAGVAENSTIKANVVASIDAFAYSVYVENRADGLFALGGVVASAKDSVIADAEVVVDITIDQATKFFVGGVAGSVYNTTVENVKVSANIATQYEDALYIGGAVGYSIGINMNEVKVNLTVKELGTERFVTKGVSSIDNTLFVTVAGAVHTINIKETASVVKNVEVKTDVDVDGIYAGVVMDVVNGNGTILVELADIIADSNVNVLKAYGFARKLVDTKVDLSKTILELIDGEEVEYNIRLTGKVRLASYMNYDEKVRMYTASVYVLENSNCEFVNGKKAVKLIVDAGILTETTAIEQIVALWGGLVKV